MITVQIKSLQKPPAPILDPAALTIKLNAIIWRSITDGGVLVAVGSVHGMLNGLASPCVKLLHVRELATVSAVVSDELSSDSDWLMAHSRHTWKCILSLHPRQRKLVYSLLKGTLDATRASLVMKIGAILGLSNPLSAEINTDSLSLSVSTP